MIWGAVREWFTTHHRDLPWRSPDTTPWAILVSEVMLQQTPVNRVIPAWHAWLARWPTPEALASAPLSDAITQWGRLGYPRRARNLYRTAVIVSTNFGGILPRSIEELMALPGIGDYTARAVACFAFGQPHPVVDTNVKRVVARAVFGLAGAGHWSVKKGLEIVDSAIDRPIADEDYCLTQKAMMELGAVVCTARNPDCGACPLDNQCAWKKAGHPVDASVLPRTQARYEGSDRQVRGIILALMRDQPGWHPGEEIDSLWDSRAQLRRALTSLVDDGLVMEDAASGGPLYGLSESAPYPSE